MPGNIVKILLLFLMLNSADASTFFVATDGDNSNDGSFDNPWATIEYGISQLNAGDTLYIRGGIYYEHTITINLNGTDVKPVLIAAYQDEEVIINGGIDSFSGAPNSQWVIVDSDIGLYKSLTSVAGSFINIWLPDDDIQIIEYEDSLNLKSENYGPVDGFNPLYQGPGAMLLDDGFIYIRLQQNPNDLIDIDSNAIPPVPADTIPGNNNIVISSSKTMFYLDSATHISFVNINFYYSKYIFDVRDNSHDITLNNCKLRYGNTGIVIRDAYNFDIHKCEFDNGLPQYVYWTDIKNKSYEVHEPYPEFQSKAISGALKGFNIDSCYFHHGFDAIGIKDNSSNTSILHNHFVVFRDDALDLRAGIDNIEIAYNILWCVGSGISMTETEANNPGQVYIHHNVIDNSVYQHGGREGNYREDNWPVWTVIDPFGSHGDDMVAYWKVYNNTIVTRMSGYHWTAAGVNGVASNSEKYVMNNIFLILDDRIVFRGDHQDGGAFYDGDVIYRLKPGSYPLFYDFGDGNNYNTLEEFINNSGTNWEQNGMEINPRLDTAAILYAGYEKSTIRERYRPRNPLCYTTGASYDSYNWPGTSNIWYRGALEPGTALWLGVNTNWNDIVNWSIDTIPDEAYKVIIPTSPQYGNFPVIQDTVNAKCFNITTENNASLIVNGVLEIAK